MRINHITYTKTNYIKPLSSKPSFQGLTKDLSRKFYPTEKEINEQCIKYENKIAGKPPQDIVNLIVQNAPDGKTASDNVKDFIKSVSDAGKELQKIDNCSLKKMANANIEELLEAFMDLLQNDLCTENPVNFIYEFIRGDYFNSQAEIEKHKNKAAKIMEKSLKQSKALPSDGYIESKYLDYGMFGYVFGFSFKDSNGNKVIHDKVIKVYKNIEKRKKTANILGEKLQEYFTSTDYESALKQIRKHINERNALNKKNELYTKRIAFIPRKFKSGFNELSQDSQSAKKFAFNNHYYLLQNEHGLIPEANTALFLKHKIGNIGNSNYIEPHFFDLKTRTALMEKADSELPNPQKEVKLNRYNLFYVDYNDSNEVCSRIVDYGGIINY